MKAQMDDDQRDDLLMGLVESALTLRAVPRQEFLASVLIRYPALYEEVKDRVAWEDRMGGFLREPLLEVRPERSGRPAAASDRVAGRRTIVKWSLAGTLAVIVALSGYLWRARSSTERSTGLPVRLVVLPIHVEGVAIASAAGLGEDVADRLSDARRIFTVMGPAEALRHRVNTAERAKLVLDATHVLRASLRSAGAQISATAAIVDTTSGQTLRQLQGDYPPGDPVRIANALIETTNIAFGLRSPVPQPPASGTAYRDFVQGLALMRRDDRSADEALPHFARAAQSDSRSAPAFAALAEAQLQKFQRGEGSQWLDLAGENVAKAKSVNRDSVPVLLASGLLRQNAGEYQLAIAEYTRVTQLQPNSAEAWERLAVAYERTYQTADAERSLLVALHLERTSQTLISAGVFYYQQERYPESVKLFEEAMTLGPPSAVLYIHLAGGYRNLGRSNDSIQSYRAGRRLAEDDVGRDPRDANSRALLALLAARLGDAHAAEKELAQTLALQPAGAIVLRNTVIAFEVLGKRQRTLEILRNAPAFLLEELSHDPDTRELSRDPRFQGLMAKAPVH